MTDEEFLGEAMDYLIAEISNYFSSLFGYRYLSCEKENGRIISVTVETDTEKVKIYADYFLDCSGSIALVRDAGCDYVSGNEGDLSSVNGATLVFHVTKKSRKITISSSEDVSDWENSKMMNTVSCFNMYSNGDININMLPTI